MKKKIFFFVHKLAIISVVMILVNFSNIGAELLNKQNHVMAEKTTSIYGNAVFYQQGPRDEILESSPIKKIPILIIPSNEIEMIDFEMVPELEIAKTIFTKFENKPTTHNITTDSYGKFSKSISPGEYYICSTYESPWNKGFYYYSCERITVEQGEQIKLKIVFMPQTKLNIIQLN